MRVSALGALLVGACSFGACSFGGTDPRPGDPDAGGVADLPDGPPPGDPDATPAPDAVVRPLVCPVSYTSEYGGHRYRFSDTQQTWSTAEDDCEDDAIGATHLIAVDDSAERDALVAGGLLAHGTAWQLIGVVRDIEDDDAPWRTVTGGNAPFLDWRATVFPPSSEPTGGEGDNAEPVVAVDLGVDVNHDPTIGGFVDVSTAYSAYYVCECDGEPPVDASYD